MLQKFELALIIATPATFAGLLTLSLFAPPALASDPIGWFANALGFQAHGTAPAASQYRQLSPLTREGYYWVNYQGGGINDQGYYNRPIAPRDAFGVDLADGTYGAPALWEGDRVEPETRVLADGTRYSPHPAVAARVVDGDSSYFVDLQNASTLTFEVRGGAIVRQDWQFAKPEEVEAACRWWEGTC